jgi:hypothetical protein
MGISSSSQVPTTIVLSKKKTATQSPHLERISRAARRTAREVLSWMFWLHAFGVSHLIRVHFYLSNAQRGEIVEVSLFAFIFTYSILAANGLWSLSFDLLYILAYPWWVFVRLLWRLIKHTHKSSIFEPFRSVATAAADLDNSTDERKSTNLSWIREKCLRPFFRFAVIWCLITLTSSNSTIKILGLCALLGALTRLIYRFVAFVHGSVGFLGTLEGRIRIQLEAALDKVLNTDPKEPDFANGVRILKFLFGVFGRFSKRQSLESFMRGVTILTAGPYYLYLAILFGFFYYGVATLTGYSWRLSDALVNAISMPFSYTDLPHIFVVRAVAWLQCLLPIFVGAETFFRRMDEKTEAIAALATRLEAAVARSDVQSRFEIFEEIRRQSPAPTVNTQTPDAQS